MKKYLIEAIDRSGNIRTGYREILEGRSPEEALEEWRYRNIYIADPQMCPTCGEDMEWADSEYTCPDCGHREFFDGHANEV